MSLWLAWWILDRSLLLGCVCFREIILLYLSRMVLCLQKFLELAKQVGEFITWKQVECPFEQDPNIIHYLHTAPIFTEDGKTLYNLLSLKVCLFITTNTLIHDLVTSLTDQSWFFPSFPVTQLVVLQISPSSSWSCCLIAFLLSITPL